MTTALNTGLNTARVDVLQAERPLWRGQLHVIAFFLSIPAGVFLILKSDFAAARVSAALYTAGLLIAFGTSASYHRLAHSYRARQIMQRCDHSTIFLLILGTYTPICLVALPRAWGIPIMCVVSAIALCGILIKIFAFQRLRTVGYVLYIVMGWVAIVAAPTMVQNLTGLQLGLIVAGGVAYTIGMPVLLLHRPDPWPKVFGYHEIWHSFTVLAAALHFVAIATVIAA